MNLYEENQMVETVETLRAQLDQAANEIDKLTLVLRDYHQAYVDMMSLVAATSLVLRDKGAPKVADVLDRRAHEIEARLDGPDEEG